jgi:hypothetical protein
MFEPFSCMVVGKEYAGPPLFLLLYACRWARATCSAIHLFSSYIYRWGAENICGKSCHVIVCKWCAKIGCRLEVNLHANATVFQSEDSDGCFCFHSACNETSSEKHWHGNHVSCGTFSLKTLSLCEKKFSSPRTKSKERRGILSSSHSLCGILWLWLAQGWSRVGFVESEPEQKVF